MAIQNNNDEEWISEPLTNVAEIIMGQSPPSTSYNKTKRGLPFFQGNKDFGDKYPTASVYTTDPKKISEKNDVLISVRAPIGDVNLAPEKCCIGRGLAAFRPKNGLNNLFLFYFTKTIRALLESKGTGSTFTGISRKTFEEVDISYPKNVDTQQEIAKRIELLLLTNNKAGNSISRSKWLLQKFRQSVISSAISGRLTENWRLNHRNTKQNEGVIKEFKTRRLEQAYTPSDKRRIERIFNSNESANWFNIPDTWQFISLDKLCESFSYGTSAKSQTSGKVPVLRMGNIQNSEIDWSNLVYTSDEKEINKYRLNKGDVLFNRTNSPELVGKTAIYNAEHPAIYAGYLIKINNLPELSSEYLNYCLNSLYAKEFCRRVRTDGVSQSNINAQKLGKFEIPFCGIEEQLEIVKRIKALLDLAGQVEKQIEITEKKVNKLNQAILGKAFRFE